MIDKLYEKYKWGSREDNNPILLCIDEGELSNLEMNNICIEANDSLKQALAEARKEKFICPEHKFTMTFCLKCVQEDFKATDNAKAIREETAKEIFKDLDKALCEPKWNKAYERTKKKYRVE